MGRLIWFHVPLKMSNGAEDKERNAKERQEEVEHAMREKRIALDLVEG